MLQSLALILICGWAGGRVMQALKLPSQLGMIVVGIVLGPHLLGLLAPSILAISADLREIALIVILIRAGLALDMGDLKQVGRPAILMSVVPAIFELVAVTIFAPMLFGISHLEAAMMGAVLAAVSPAIVVPRMLRLMEQGYGKAKGIPQLIMVGATVNGIFVIVLLTSFLGMYGGYGFDLISLAQIPLAILTGCALGTAGGWVCVWLFQKVPIHDTAKALLVLSVAFLFLSVERVMPRSIPLSGLLAVMALGAVILSWHKESAERLSGTFSNIWVGAEIFLFVLVGAAVDITYAGNAGFSAVLLIGLALALRIAGVFLSLVKTKLDGKERLYSAISYVPKATVQAAIGGLPLAMGVAAGNMILTLAVLAILITAPLGAIAMDVAYEKLLCKSC